MSKSGAISDEETNPSDLAPNYDDDNSDNEEYAGYTEEECYTAIWDIVEKRKPYLKKRFFPTEESLKEHAPGVGAMFKNLRDRGAPEELAMEFLILTLYDVVILADDSFSMNVKEKGKRKEILKTIISLISDVYTLARPQGLVSLKFFNNPPGYKNITPKKVPKAIAEHRFSGVTRIGSELKLKILNQYAQLKDMKKPLLVMIITDGAVEGEDPNLLKDVIVDCIVKMHADGDDPKASQAISFHFSQIGKDKDAKRMLEELDDDKRIGQYIDCLPVDFALDKLHGKNPGDVLTDNQWMTLGKLILGGILDTWDEKHHKTYFVDAQKDGYDKLKENEIVGGDSDIELDED